MDENEVEFEESDSESETTGGSEPAPTVNCNSNIVWSNNSNTGNINSSNSIHNSSSSSNSNSNSNSSSSNSSNSNSSSGAVGGRVEYIGILSIRPLRGLALPCFDEDIGPGDPYLLMQLGRQLVKSSVIEGTIEPSWGGEVLSLSWNGIDRLIVELWDASSAWDSRDRGERKGRAEIELELEEEEEEDDDDDDVDDVEEESETELKDEKIGKVLTDGPLRLAVPADGTPVEVQVPMGPEGRVTLELSLLKLQ